ncbi:MAG: type II secretion system F family protein [Oscillospiraceae bacterium]|nr:type II secretion system F family protein [Oscillospiraceae bacterium]
MRLLNLIVGTIIMLVFVVQSLAKADYDSLVEELPPESYPLKSIYKVGFMWSKIGFMSLRGGPRDMLIGQAKLLHDPQYSEYYAAVVWAQVISFVHLFAGMGLLLAGAFDFTFFAVVGIAMAGVSGYYFFQKMGEELKSRRDHCFEELPEVVSTIALLINSGMILREAWSKVAIAKEGVLYDLMKQSCDDMENGVSEVDAIHRFGVLSGTPEIKKFTSSLIQSMEKGGKDLSDFLSIQSNEMWNEKKQYMLQKGEVAATKLLIPITIIFAGILGLVISAAVGILL